MTPGAARRLAVALLSLGAAAAAGLCAAVLAVGLRLSAPRPAAVGPPPPDLPGAEAVEFPSASGSLLRGWWVPAPPPGGGGAVVLLHGAWENRLRMLPRARALHAAGFAVLLFDLQAHGESPGRRITFGRLEGLDAAAAARFVRGRAPGERLGAIGASLGGAAAVLAPEPLGLDALVLEAVYPDIEAALANRLHAGLGPAAGPLLAPVLAPLFRLLLPPVLGVAPEALRPADRIRGLASPVLVASGTRDDRTPLAEARALFDAAPGPKRLWAVEGAAHEDLERRDPDAYRRVVLPFLRQELRRGGGGGARGADRREPGEGRAAGPPPAPWPPPPPCAKGSGPVPGGPAP